MVTDPAPWACAHDEPDKDLIDILAGMMRKDPVSRMTLDQAACDVVLERASRRGRAASLLCMNVVTLPAANFPNAIEASCKKRSASIDPSI